MKVTTIVVDELATAKELLDVLQRIERVAEKVQIQFGFLTIKDVVKLALYRLIMSSQVSVSFFCVKQWLRSGQ